MRWQSSRAECPFVWGRSNTAFIQNVELRRARPIENQTAVSVVDTHDAIGFALLLSFENCFERLHGGDGLAVGGGVIVGELAGFLEPLATAGRIAAKLDVGQLADESLDDFDPVAPLRSLSPRLDERAVVMVVDRILERDGSLPLDRAL